MGAENQPRPFLFLVWVSSRLFPGDARVAIRGKTFLKLFWHFSKLGVAHSWRCSMRFLPVQNNRSFVFVHINNAVILKRLKRFLYDN
jgi:hypothetical protein